jgi:hypothetical protein
MLHNEVQIDANEETLKIYPSVLSLSLIKNCWKVGLTDFL